MRAPNRRRSSALVVAVFSSDVVEQAGGDDFVRLAVAAQKPSHLDRMVDERRVVDLPALPGVACSGKPQRGLRHRQPGKRLGGAARSFRGAGRGLSREGDPGLSRRHAHQFAVLTASSPYRCSSARVRAGSPSRRRSPGRASPFPAARPGVSTPAPAAWEIGSPPRPRRIIAHPTAIAAPASGPTTYTQRGGSEALTFPSTMTHGGPGMGRGEEDHPGDSVDSGRGSGAAPAAHPLRAGW